MGLSFSCQEYELGNISALLLLVMDLHSCIDLGLIIGLGLGQRLRMLRETMESVIQRSKEDRT